MYQFLTIQSALCFRGLYIYRLNQLQMENVENIWRKKKNSRKFQKDQLEFAVLW